uniref:(California timema) hypothetical protein n=1 Tax=Timema californicum TaxID=61474 RepID=A0A7R9J6S8_TIMCA|nr:unnamed protein product [Timema californicum]
MPDYSRLRKDRNMSCGTCIAKYCLCLFNFIFFVSTPLTGQLTNPGFLASTPLTGQLTTNPGFLIAGAVALGVGIWIAQDKHSFIAATQIIENKELQIELESGNCFGKTTLSTPGRSPRRRQSILTRVASPKSLFTEPFHQD